MIHLLNVDILAGWLFQEHSQWREVRLTTEMLAAEKTKNPSLPPSYCVQEKEVTILMLFYLIRFYM